MKTVTFGKRTYTVFAEDAANAQELKRRGASVKDLGIYIDSAARLCECSVTTEKLPR